MELRLYMLYIYMFQFYQMQTTSASLSKHKKDELKATKLPPCTSCKVLVESFQKGMEKTARGKFEGGDAAWEEKLGKYKTSEIRLTEVEEGLCTEVERGQDQCHSLAEETEQLLEEWWFHYQNESTDLQQWLCIDKLKHCCPENHYGTECFPCKGLPNVCSGNGKCKGSGTRKGNGDCTCNKGYSGSLCNECTLGYYESFRDSNKLLCTPCHVACLDQCTGPGPQSCILCNNGWILDKEKGCIDIDECYNDRNLCTKNKFCINNEGSFSCLDCDKSCSGCSGDGPDMCNVCAKGYILKNKMCIDEANEERASYVTTARYLTYAGLCLATCIVLQSSTSLAAAVGLAVALYISVSEYLMHTLTPTPDPNSVDWASVLGIQ